MNRKNLWLAFLRTVLTTTLYAVVVLGIFGYLTAGTTQGLLTGVGWGLVLGLVSAPFTAYAFARRFRRQQGD